MKKSLAFDTTDVAPLLTFMRFLSLYNSSFKFCRAWFFAGPLPHRLLLTCKNRVVTISLRCCT